MKDFFEELKKYFETTPQSKILEDWAKTAEFDNVGPTVDEFLHHTKKHFQVRSSEPLGSCFVGINEYNPKFSSDFFMSSNK